MLKFLKIILTVFGLLWQTCVLFAQNVTVTIPDVGAPAGKNVNVDISVSDLSGLQVFSMDFKLLYNRNQLENIGVTGSGSISSSWGSPTVNNVPGQVSVAFAGDHPLSGSGRLLRLQFHVSEKAATGSSSQLVFLSFKFNEEQPQTSLKNGTFTVTADQEPPVITSGPTVTQKNYHDVKIFIRTDEPSTVELFYGESTNYGEKYSDKNLDTKHTLQLANLIETTTYHYKIQLTDSLANGPRVSTDYSFQTKAVSINLPDFTADPGTGFEVPVTVSDLSPLNVTKSDLSFQFDNNQLQISGIKTTGTILKNWPALQVTISNGEFTLHAVGSAPLGAGDKLFFIKGTIPQSAILDNQSALIWTTASFNDRAIRLVSGNGSVTVKDRMPPLIISGPDLTEISYQSVKILWQTNEPATSLIDYGESAAYSFQKHIDRFVTNHDLQLTGLDPATRYHFRIGGKDASNNGPTWTGDATFTTGSADVLVEVANKSTTANSIFRLPVKTTDITGYAIKKWEALIGYDPELLIYVGADQNGSLSQSWNPIESVENAGFISLSATGSSALSGMGNVILLGFQAKSVQGNKQTQIDLLSFRYDDGWPAAAKKSGIVSISGTQDQTAPRIIWGPYVDQITGRSARLNWRTDETARAGVEYGTSYSYGNQFQESEFDSIHHVTLTGLQTNTEYHYRLQNQDIAGNISPYSSDSLFTTLTGNSVPVSVPDLSVIPGATVEVPLQVGNITGQNIFSFDITILYDQNKLTAQSVGSNGTISSSWNPVYSLFPGQVVIASGGIQALQGSGKLVKIRFKVNNDIRIGEQTFIQFASFVFNDGSPPVTYKNGVLKIKDRQPPVLSDGPFAFNVKTHSAVIAWRTDEISDSRIFYGMNAPNELITIDEFLYKSHSILLDGLVADTGYRYQIASRDSSGNEWRSGQTYSFTTKPEHPVQFQVGNGASDVNQPVSIPLSISGNGSRPLFDIKFVVMFNDQLIQYQSYSVSSPGLSDWTAAVNTVSEGRLSFHLYGDQPFTREGEFLKIRFRSQAGDYGSKSDIGMQELFVNNRNTSLSVQNGSFLLIDRTPPQFLTNPVASQIHENSVNISWQADEPVRSLLAYGSALEDTIRITSASAAVEYNLTNLQPGTAYKFRIGITDTIGNGPIWSVTEQFTTSLGNEVDIVLPDTSFAIGDTVLIPVMIGEPGTANILKYRFLLVHPADQLKFLTTVHTASLTESWSKPEIAQVADTVSISQSFSQKVTHSGVLLYLKFLIRKNVAHNRQLFLRLKEFVFNNGVPPAAVSNGSILCKDETPPLFLSSPEQVLARLKSVLLRIRTDEFSRLKIHYGQTAGSTTNLLNIDDPDTTHVVEIKELLPNQNYSYQVAAFDSLNNGPALSEILSFHTSEAAIKLSLPDTSITANTEFLLPVSISDVTDFDITRYELQFHYNSRFLQPLSVVVAHSLSSTWVNSSFSNENATIHFSNSGDKPLTGHGTLFVLHFQVTPSAVPGDSARVFIEQASFQNNLFPVTTDTNWIFFKQPVVENLELFTPDTTAYLDSDINTYVKISDISDFNVFSYSLIVKIDRQVLAFQAISTNNTMTASWQTPNLFFIGDSLFVKHSGEPALHGSGKLFTLNFSPQQNITNGIKSNVELIDFQLNNAPVPANIKNGSITFIDRVSKIAGFIKDVRSREIIPDAKIFALDSLQQVISSATSNSDGYFELLHLKEYSHYDIFATKSDYTPSDTLRHISPGLSINTLFLMKQDGVISGKLTDMGGNPIDGAIIVLNNSHGFNGSENSDQNGEFHLENLDRKYPYKIFVQKNGFKNYVVDHVMPDTTLLITLVWQTGKIYGTTLNESDEPVSDVVIRFFDQNTNTLVAEIKTNGNGEFAKDSLKAISYLITAEKNNYLSIPRQQIVHLSDGGEKFVEFHLKSYRLASVKITGGSNSIPNNRPSQFSYTALSQGGETINRLNNLQWKISPAMAGTVDSGIVKPDSSYLGAVSLLVHDTESGLRDTLSLFIYAEIQPEHAVSLHDAANMELIIPENSVSQKFDLKFNLFQPQSIKSSTRAHRVVGTGYDFKPDGQIFLQPIILRLPVPGIYRGAELAVGRWEPNRAEWKLLPGSKKVTGGQVEVPVYHFTLFALLVPSKPLGIHQVQFSPNPFSPFVDSDGNGNLGVDIKFSVSSKNIRQPFVNIKIYSILGELVREVIVNEPLDKGKLYSFNWDGKTDMGRTARNGRYLVRIEAKDQQGIETYLGQVVLIK